MRLISGLMLLLALVAGGQSLAHAQMADTAADLAAIAQVREALVAADNAGDATAFAAQFAEDGALLPSNEPAAMGRAAVEAHLQQQHAAMAPTLAVTSREANVAGDIGYDTGSYTLTLTPKAGGDPISADGKYIVTLGRQADGSWKIRNLIYNENAPVAMPAAMP